MCMRIGDSNEIVGIFMNSCICACASLCLYGLLRLRSCFSVVVWTLNIVRALVFLRVFHGLLCSRLCLLVFVRTQELRLRFSVFVWTLFLALVFRSVWMDSCALACVSQCLYWLLYLRLCLRLRFLVFVRTEGFSQYLQGLLCFCLRFAVAVWTLVLALAFFSICMDSYACARVPQLLYWLSVRLHVSVFLESCACACVSQSLFRLLCLRLRFSGFVWTLVLAVAFLCRCTAFCSCACVFLCDTKKGITRARRNQPIRFVWNLRWCERAQRGLNLRPRCAFCTPSHTFKREIARYGSVLEYFLKGRLYYSNK